MSEVKQAYLRDEDGKIFSPVVSAESVILNNGESFGEKLENNLFETLIFKGVVTMSGNNVLCFPVTTTHYHLAGDISNSEYFKVPVDGYYRVRVNFRWSDSGTSDRCISVVFTNVDGSEIIENNWSPKFHRLTSYINTTGYLRAGGKITIRGYDLDGLEANPAMDVSVFAYIPYSKLV